MKNENRQYLLGVNEDLEKYFEGIENEDGDVVGIFDYLDEEVLDFEITIDSRCTYQSCKVYLTLGGPTVWIDTANRSLNIAWGTDNDSIYIENAISDWIDMYYEEYYRNYR